MRQQEPGRGDLIGPQDWLKTLPFELAASSHGLGWAGLVAARNRVASASALNAPPLPTTGFSL